MPKLFPRKAEKVQRVTDAPIKSNRRNFKFAAYVIAMLWLMSFLFALSALWVPAVGLAASFSGTSWLFGWIAFIGTGLWLFLANEFMDLEQ